MLGSIEGRRQPRFLQEALDAIPVRRARAREYLQRDVAAQSQVSGAVDVAHPAAGEERRNAVRSDDRPGPERPVRVCQMRRGEDESRRLEKTVEGRARCDQLVGVVDELGPLRYQPRAKGRPLGRVGGQPGVVPGGKLLPAFGVHRDPPRGAASSR